MLRCPCQRRYQRHRRAANRLPAACRGFIHDAGSFRLGAQGVPEKEGFIIEGPKQGQNGARTGQSPRSLHQACERVSKVRGIAAAVASDAGHAAAVV